LNGCYDIFTKTANLYQKLGKVVLKWLIIVNRAVLRYVNAGVVLPFCGGVVIFAIAMKRSLHVVILLCLLCMGACRSHKQSTVGGAVSSRPSRPVSPPVTGSTADSNDAMLVARLIDGAYGWIGTPYRYGGADRKGADCSGFVQRLFADIVAVSLPRNSRKQAEYCRPVSRNLLQPGDLVFFNGSRVGSGIGHVGLYVGDGRMIHASSSRGVTVSDISADYYRRRYCGGGRVAAITYAARGTRPGSVRELPAAVAPQPRPQSQPQASVQPEPVLSAPRPSDVPEATIDENAGIVVQSAISALVDSAFAAAARAERADSVCADWMD